MSLLTLHRNGSRSSQLCVLLDWLLFHKENTCNADDEPQDKEAQRQTLRAARLNIYNADSHNEQAGQNKYNAAQCYSQRFAHISILPHVVGSLLW